MIRTSPFDTTALAEHAYAADAQPIWPEASWQALRHTSALRWCIPANFGGNECNADDLLDGYERLAAACLTTCFLLSQRDAACRRIRDAGNRELAAELLPALARGERFATVGISQLTTSRQHGKPALTARLEGDVVVFDGTMPWVTGAARADHLVTGAVLDDGRQVLAAMPTRLPGVRVGPPLDLAALQGSITAAVVCDSVRLDRRWLLAGPAEKVLATSRGGAGGLETSCLALGLAGAAVDYLHDESASRPELIARAGRLEQARQHLRHELHKLARDSATADTAVALRARANALVLKATHAALAASKGTGFIRNHPAQRWARQALFFLVWSCPRQAAEATLDLF